MVRPAAVTAPNMVFDSFAIEIPFNNRIKYKDKTVITPINPSSSPIMEKIKSVCGSGR